MKKTKNKPMTLKRPEKYTGIDAECEEGQIHNAVVTDYDAWLTEAMKELRELYKKYPKDGIVVEGDLSTLLELNYSAFKVIHNFLKRVDKP